MGKSLMNYDPNLVLCGRMAKQTVRLTFGNWQARCVKETVVSGNCTGFDVIEAAVENIYEELPTDKWGSKTIVMESSDDTLECSDDDGREEMWLKDMLIAAEIVSIEPCGE